MPKRGASFATAGYVPELGHVVHLNWNPAVGHEMIGPHYGLVLSATLFNNAVGLAIVVPITTARGKLSGFEFPVATGRVKGVALLSAPRSLDYQARDVQYEATVPPADIAEANRLFRLIFP